jgi:quercetin dioxygenase-like cupin family protein
MSVINRFTGSPEKFSWENVVPKAYADKEGITKHVLIGENEGSKDFIIRYFELEPGKSSNLEHHEHVHGVVIACGKGKVQLNDKFYDLGPMDSVFVSPNDTHQFTNTGDGIFGFICVIKAW